MKKYYKVIKNEKVIDVLDQLIFLKYQPKHNIMVQCEESEAQAILSSDSKYIWHEESLYKIPVDGYDTVHVEEIDQYSYRQLKMLNMSDPQSIIDDYTLFLIESGVLQ